MRLFRNLIDITDPSSQTVPTVEPSYTYESDSHLAHFEIELPGVAKEDISVDINAHKLIVKGNRFKKQYATEVPNQQENCADVKVMEQEEQDAQQTMQVEEEATPERKPKLIYLLEARIGHGADMDAIQAKHCGDGILTVLIPMKVEKQARRIAIGL